jgi:lipid-A-disaccharide synthase
MPSTARRLSFYNSAISFNISYLRPNMSKRPSIMIVAGEASGDAHAAKLVRALREAEPDADLDIFGAAGPRMRAAGVDAVIRSDDLAIVGLIEIAVRMSRFLAAFRRLRNAAKQRKPDAVILVDFPDFNLKLARSLKKLGLTVVYYISPQLWAWRRHRVDIVNQYIDLMLAILPFEKEWYAKHGVDHVEYVGSPLAREVHVTRDKGDFCHSHALDPGKPIIAMLPGSRTKEIMRVLPVMLDTASRIAGRRPEVQFLIAAPSAAHEPAVRAIIERAATRNKLPEPLRIVENETYDALNASNAAAITSGTATLEAAIIGTPMVVVYKTSAINYRLLAPMIDVEHYGLVNLIAGKRVAMELIQDDFTAEALTNELLRLLEPEVNSAVRGELHLVSETLGHGGASKRAAAAILDLITDKKEAAAGPPIETNSSKS